MFRHLRFQYLQLRSEPDDGPRQAIVDTAELSNTHTFMAETGLSSKDASAELDGIVRQKLTGFLQRVLATHQEKVFSPRTTLEIQTKVFEDYRSEIRNIADAIRTYQVAAHLPSHAVNRE